MSEESKLEVKIVTTADTSGTVIAQQAVDSLNKTVDKSTDVETKHAKASKEVSEKLRETGHSAHGTQEIIEGLTRVQEGGIQGFLGLVSGMRGFIAVARGAAAGALPFAGIVTIIAGLAAAVVALKDNFAGTAVEIGNAKKGSDDLKVSLAQLKADKAESVALQIKLISDQAQATIDKLILLKDTLLHLNENQLAIDKSKNATNPNLTPAQKEQGDFKAENDARQKAFKLNDDALKAEIEKRKKESAKQDSAVKPAVADESALRKERLSLIEQRNLAEDEVKKTKEEALAQRIQTNVPISAPGGQVVFSDLAQDPKAQEKANAAQSRLKEINERLAAIDGVPGKDKGLLADAHDAAVVANKGASDVGAKNFGDSLKPDSVGEIEQLENKRKLNNADFIKQQYVANNDFVAKQDAANKKLFDEQSSLQAEKKVLEDKNLHAGFGGDPAANARLTQIAKRQAEIQTEASQRSTVVPRVKEDTEKLSKEFQSQFKDTISSVAAEGAKPDLSPKRPGTITGPDGKIHTVGETTGPGKITTADGRVIEAGNPAGPGTITREGKTFTVTGADSVGHQLNRDITPGAHLTEQQSSLASGATDIAKAGATIKQSGEATATHLTEIGNKAVEGAKAAQKAAEESAKKVTAAAPAIQKAISATSESFGKYNEAILSSMYDFNARLKAAEQTLRAQADRN